MLEEIFDDEYPKDGTLDDGTHYTVRLLTPDDVSALHTFFQSIPREDRLFLRDDVSDKSVIEDWCQHMDLEMVVPIVAEVDGRIVGEATLHRERRGWMSHVGKIRLVIHPDFRRHGLARTMLHELIEVALHTGSIQQLNSECMDTQKSAIRMCETAGFAKRAVLPDQVRDLAGDLHDLVILSYDLRDEEFHGID